MKAIEWIEKFTAATSSEGKSLVFEEYGKETAELVLARSKTSSDKTKLSAMEGAINEQRTKFRSIINRVPTLNMSHFEDILDKHVQNYRLEKVKSEKKPEVKTETTDPEAGRKLVKNGNRSQFVKK